MLKLSATLGGVLLLVTVISAQNRTGSTAPDSATNELLSEIKALRADLNQRLDASMRAQLLVARLALQEQRITTLARQLTDIQQQLHNNERGRGPLEAQLKMFEAAQASEPESEKKGSEFVIGPLRSHVEQLAKADDELKRQQVYLTGLLAEEQSRWTAFNARLEELEQLLTPKTPPRDR